MTTFTDRAARRGAAALAAGLLLGALPVATAAEGAPVLPAAKMTATLSDNNNGMSGSSKVYNASDIILFRVNVAPNKAGKSVTLRINRFVTGSFVPLYSRAVTLDGTSSTGINVRDWQPGGTYNAQWSFAGDSVNRASTSNFVNFKMTGKETDLKPVKIALTLPGKPVSGSYRYKAGTAYATTVTVTRNVARPAAPNKPNVYVEQYNAATKKWTPVSKVAVTTVVSKANPKVSSGRYAFTRPAGTYRVRADYLSDAFNSRASTAWSSVVVTK